MPFPDDDSCPKCGHISDGGLAHYICPGECGECGFIGDLNTPNGCPSCHVWKVFIAMTDDEKMAMNGLLNDS